MNFFQRIFHKNTAPAQRLTDKKVWRDLVPVPKWDALKGIARGASRSGPMQGKRAKRFTAPALSAATRRTSEISLGLRWSVRPAGRQSTSMIG